MAVNRPIDQSINRSIDQSIRDGHWLRQRHIQVKALFLLSLLVTIWFHVTNIVRPSTDIENVLLKSAVVDHPQQYHDDDKATNNNTSRNLLAQYRDEIEKFKHRLAEQQQQLLDLGVPQDDITAAAVDIDGILPSSTSTTSTTTTTTISNSSGDVVHILYGLFGKNTAFFQQWEVSVKSVLLNLPLDQPLHLHLICNQLACDAILTILSQQETGLKDSRWRQPLTITLYNVEALEKDLFEYIASKNVSRDFSRGRHTLGAMYRLLAHKIILPHNIKSSVSQPSINSVVYLDADVIVLNNLGSLWNNHVENEEEKENADNDTNDIYNPAKNIQFHWGPAKNPCSGFAIYNLNQMDQFWENVQSLNGKNGINSMQAGDQSIMREVELSYPNTTRPLPDHWSIHMGHGYRPHPQNLLSQKASMVHFTGKPLRYKTFFDPDTGSVEQYCSRSASCKKDPKKKKAFLKSWGLVEYYVRLSWPWLLHFTSSQIPKGSNGHKINIQVLDLP